MPLLCVIPLCLVLNDVGLCVAFDRAATSAARSRCLVELSRRGGPVAVSFLTRKRDELLAPQGAGGDRGRRDESTVEFLTALRRAQGQPDPVPVVVSVPGEGESIFPNLPVVDGALVYRDVQKTPVTFREGGDYRSGRQERWRFAVRDPRGKAMPVRSHWGSGIGGGIYAMAVLKPGESWGTALPMRNFIDLPPGDYTAVVQYHDEETIAGLPDTKGLLVCQSEPFKLHVQPRVIDVTRADRAAAREAIAALPDKGPVQILEGPYGEDARGFIGPDSGAGRLLALGWRAVPALLDALDDEAAPGQRRGGAVALPPPATGLDAAPHPRRACTPPA